MENHMKMKHEMTGSYSSLALMGILHFPLMYLIMFTMIYSTEEFYNNLNMAYMAVMMVAPMILLMPLMMGMMYQDRRLNFLVYGVSIALFLAGFYFTREQTFIGDKQFIRSMIPHHSGAILMCEKAKLEDSELRSLCSEIVKAQKNEIDQLKTILQRMD